MRRSAKAAAALLPLLTVSAMAAGEVTTLPSGWTITSTPRPGKAIDRQCTLRSPAADVSVGLYNFPLGTAEGSSRGAARIIFIVADKLFDKNQDAIKVEKISIAGQRDWSNIEMNWRSRKIGGTLTASLDPKIDAILPALARGKAIDFTVAKSDGSSKDYSIPLKGSAEAVFAYEKCLATVKWTKGGAAAD